MKPENNILKYTVLPVIDSEKHKTISYSQFSTYKKCPHKWYLTYVKKLDPQTSTIHTIFGTSIHETVQTYLTKVYNESGVKADAWDYKTYLHDQLVSNYKESVDKYKVNFSSPDELREFYHDGIHIMEFLKKNRRKYFNTKNTELLGIEIPIITVANNDFPDIFFKGYIDIILYHAEMNRYIIYDIKSSTSGWKDYHKKDETKLSQLLLYKEYFSKLYNVSQEDIDVQFFILKRKIWEEAEFAAAKKRIQEFIPANGKGKVRKAVENLSEFVKDCFTTDNTYIDKEYPKNPSKECDWCPFNLNKTCDKNEKIIN